MCFQLQFLGVQKLPTPGLQLVRWDIPQNFPRRRHAGSLEGMAVPGWRVLGRGRFGITVSLSSCRGDTPKLGLVQWDVSPTPQG